MKKCFHIYNYFDILKAQMAIYNSTGNVDIWWQDIKMVKNLKEKYLTWSVFKKYFKMKFLSQQYYEERAKEFYELKLGSMSMKELSSKFLSLLIYVSYIINENPEIERFLGCLPTSFKDRIEFDNPKTLEEAMRKADFCYEQSKKREILPNWKNKKTSQFDQKRRGFNSNNIFENKSQNFSKNNYQITIFKNKAPQNPTTPKGKDIANNFVKNNEQKEPVKC